MGFNQNKFLSPLFRFFGKPLANVTPINLDIAQFNSTTNQWELATGIIGNAVQSSSNVGGGAGLALPRVLDDLPFKSILAGTGISIVVTPTTIEIISTSTGNRKLFSQRRQVSIYPESENKIGLIMVGEGKFNLIGAQNEFFDVDGYFIQNVPSGGMGAEDAGLFIINCVRRQHNFDITIKFRITVATDVRFWAGFFTADPISDDNPIAEHIALRLSTTASNVNFVISHADGVTQAETQLALADTAIHTIRIVADEANSKFQYSFDGAPLADLTTNIPASTTDLDIFVESFDTAGGTNAIFDFWYLDGDTDK